MEPKSQNRREGLDTENEREERERAQTRERKTRGKRDGREGKRVNGERKRECIREGDRGRERGPR